MSDTTGGRNYTIGKIETLKESWPPMPKPIPPPPNKPPMPVGKQVAMLTTENAVLSTAKRVIDEIESLYRRNAELEEQAREARAAIRYTLQLIRDQPKEYITIKHWQECIEQCERVLDYEPKE